MALKEYEGKNVYVVLNSKRRYQGKVIEVEFLGPDKYDVDIYLISMIDKFGQHVTFSNKEIGSIEEEKRDGDERN